MEVLFLRIVFDFLSPRSQGHKMTVSEDNKRAIQWGEKPYVCRGRHTLVLGTVSLGTTPGKAIFHYTCQVIGSVRRHNY